MENILKELTVNASQQTAFTVFTQAMDTWWPRTHHIGATPMTEMVLEPKEKGKWYSRHEDGSECTVGEVLTWKPYDLIVLSWQINGNFKYDPQLVTEVEVRFIADGEERTLIKMQHKDIAKLMGGAKVIEDMDKGWGQILELFKQITEA